MINFFIDKMNFFSCCFCMWCEDYFEYSFEVRMSIINDAEMTVLLFKDY